MLYTLIDRARCQQVSSFTQRWETLQLFKKNCMMGIQNWEPLLLVAYQPWSLPGRIRQNKIWRGTILFFWVAKILFVWPISC